MKTVLIIIGVCLALGFGFMLFLMASFYFSSPIGKAVNPNKTSGFFWGKFNKGKKIYYSGGGGNFSGGRELLGVDPNSFEIISYSYAKDKNTVYFEDSPIDVDLATFYVDEDYTPKDANHVYMLQKPVGEPAQALIIDGADPKTYQEVKNQPRWGKDHQHYFHETQKVDVDYDSFVFLSRQWAKDKYALYQLTSEGFNLIEANVDALEFIYSTYVRDDKTVFFNGHMHGDDDPEGLIFRTFDYSPDSPLELISNAHIRHNGKIYYYGIATEIDAPSFKAFTHEEQRLLYGFSKDKHHVYQYNKILEHIDAASFIYQDDIFKDKNNHYDIHGKVITPLNESAP